MSLDFDGFKERAAVLCGIDLKRYKNVQMDRRIQSLMATWGIKDYDEYYHVLQTNPVKFQEFLKKLTINVSEFYRNPERFEELQKRILPDLLAQGSTVNIWSAGCSNGSEPYTLAMIFRQIGAGHRVRIMATDVDRIILDKAEAAVYNKAEVKNVAPELLKKYFRVHDDQFHLSSEIKKMVEFRQHNLLHDKFPTGIDLILCRNVVIYFTEEAKRELYQKFYQTLKPGGYLMVGGTEPLLYYRTLGFENPITFFYRRAISSSENNSVI